MSQRAIVRWSPSGQTERWYATTLDKLGKNEEFLEAALANSPELIGLESRRTGIRGPFKLFRQVSMETPSGRSILPDIVIFAASGHVIVVEVKRYVNPELRDRAVIAQIIDYASSFSALTEPQCRDLFGSHDVGTWADCVETMFPDDPSLEELADALLQRIQRGELNLVIACDKIPAGLPEVVSGIATQSTLGFDLDLVEVTPFVREISESAEILFVPSTRLATQIVSRTAITVTYQEGDSQPSTSVQATSIEAIEESLKSATRRANPDARTWIAEEVEEAFLQHSNSVAQQLLAFAKAHSVDHQFLARGKTVNPSFGFYVQGLDGETLRRVTIFSCATNWNYVCVYMNHASSIAAPQTMITFGQKLKAVFGEQIDTDAKAPSISLDLVAEHFNEFQQLMLWFKSQAEFRQVD